MSIGSMGGSNTICQLVGAYIVINRNCALSLVQVATRSERVIGPLAVIDQNQRRLSGPPRVS